MAKILLGVTGSIAAYKSIELVHLLKKSGHVVKVVLTIDGQNFVTKTTLMALGADVYTDIKSNQEISNKEIMQHINLAKWPDLVVIAPISANTISKIAYGLGDNLLTATILASNAPVYLVPAMNMYMWHNSIIQQNINKLKEHDYRFLGPDVGIQACGDEGEGRMLEAKEVATLITHAILATNNNDEETSLNNGSNKTDSFMPKNFVSLMRNKYNKSCAGLKVVITTGATIESIDPVRYISNHSSGKMGVALAYAFNSCGATVRLIAGVVDIELPNTLASVVRANSTEEMFLAVQEACKDADIFISCAAVTDYKATEYREQKIKKSAINLDDDSSRNVTSKDNCSGDMMLNLTKTIDIVATIKKNQPNLFVAGFAAETDNLIEYAKAKLIEKKINMIIANDVSNNKVFGNDETEVIIIDKAFNSLPLKPNSKNVIAHEIRKIISQYFNRHNK